MEAILAIVVGVLFASGLYMMMRRSIVKVVVGIALLGHGVNLLIFTLGRTTRGASPIIPTGESTLPETAANPLPQALILTAIVISFGVLAFTLALMREVYRASGTGDVQALQFSDQLYLPEGEDG